MLGYVSVKEESEKRLHFSRQPGINSWGILVGFSAFGIGIGYYGNDPVYMKLLYLVLTVVMGLSSIDDWEDCEFDKTTGEIRLKKVSIWDILTNRQQDVVVISISEVMDSSVKEENVSFFGKSYQVVLHLTQGASVGITESFSFGSSSEHEAVASKIHKFLDLENKIIESDDPDSDSTEGEDEDTADDFECIDKSELLDECGPDKRESMAPDAQVKSKDSTVADDTSVEQTDEGCDDKAKQAES